MPLAKLGWTSSRVKARLRIFEIVTLIVFLS
jgi:hypothetical protein